MNTKNKIKKLFSLAILVMALVSFTAGAAETIYESFDYTAGTDLTGSGGVGFDGVWFTTSNGDAIPLFTVKDGGLSFATPGIGGAYVLDVAGNSAYRATEPGRAQANRAISAASQTALLANGSTIWFSVLYVNPTSNVSAFVIGTDIFDPNETHLLSSYPDTGQGFGFGTSGDPNIVAIAYDGTATPITVDSGITASAAKLIAGKITWAAGGGNDTLSLYEVTDLTGEPTTPIATVSTYLDQSTFDLVALQHNADKAIFDEIRFGATFADVSPFTFVPDAVPPTVTELSPADDATDVMGDSDLVAIFSENIVVGIGNITIRNLTDETETVIDVTDAEQVSVAEATLTINPTANFEGGKNYAIQIDATAIEDFAANTYAGIADDTTWNFTIESVPPTVTELNPADDSNPVTYNDFALVVTFSENIAVGTGNITIKNFTDFTQTVIDVNDIAQVSVAGAVLTINPTVNIIGAKDYAIQIDAGAIEDLAANAYAGIADDTTWNFTTIPLDELALNLLVYEPFDYEVGNIDPNLPVNEETGLIGAWEIVSGSGVAPVIQEKSVAYETLPVTGGSWNDGEGVWQKWHIEADLDPATLDGYLEDGDELWFSFTCTIPLLNQLTPQNRHQLRIATDENNYIGIHPNKTERFGPGQFQAMISVNGIQTIGSTSVLFEENVRLYVGRVIFDSIDTVEAYLPDTDLALPAAPVSIVTGSVDQSTFAKIRSIIDNGNSMSQDEIRIGTTYASVIGYPLSPDVYPGGNMVSWSGGEAQLDATVFNNDPADLQMPLTYTWTHDAPEGFTVSFDPNPDVEDPIVTITKDALTGDATVITLQLTASNVGGRAPHFAAMKANMTIDLYDEPCQAFKTAGMAINDSDVNTDCDTDLVDFAVLAEGWLVDYELTAPVAK